MYPVLRCLSVQRWTGAITFHLSDCAVDSCQFDTVSYNVFLMCQVLPSVHVQRTKFYLVEILEN